MRRLPARMRQRAVSSGLLLAAALCATPAWADIWGYVDEQGLPHFASSRIDERYQLFLRDSEVVEPHKPTQAAPKESASTVETLMPEPLAALPPAPAASTAPMPRIVALFEGSPDYKPVTRLLREASETHGIDYALLQAVIATESGFNRHAVSPKGAVGLMQLIPPTAQRYGVTAGKNASIEQKLTDPKINIKAGSRYLSDLIKMFPGQIELALAAYNAGEGAVQRAGNKVPNYPETKNYVKTVMQLYTVLKPPSPTLATGSGTGRVRVEMTGGASGRGNMVPWVRRPSADTAAGVSRE
jgi:Transglycosylase SLT domain